MRYNLIKRLNSSVEVIQIVCKGSLSLIVMINATHCQGHNVKSDYCIILEHMTEVDSFTVCYSDSLLLF